MGVPTRRDRAPAEFLSDQICADWLRSHGRGRLRLDSRQLAFHLVEAFGTEAQGAVVPVLQVEVTAQALFRLVSSLESGALSDLVRDRLGGQSQIPDHLACDEVLLDEAAVSHELDAQIVAPCLTRVERLVGGYR